MTRIELLRAIRSLLRRGATYKQVDCLLCLRHGTSAGIAA